FLSARITPGTGDGLRARQVEQPFAHELPYWAFVDAGGHGGQPTGVAVHVDLTYSASLELTGIDTDCLDADALNQISLGLHSALQGFAPGVMLQFSHWTDGAVSSIVEAYRAEARGEHELGRVLVAEKAEALLRSPGLRRSHLLLTVSIPPVRTGG